MRERAAEIDILIEAVAIATFERDCYASVSIRGYSFLTHYPFKAHPPKGRAL